MLVIGLTGGIGSGKSTVAELFSKKGITIIDTDQISRDLTQPTQPAFIQIIKKFGQHIVLANQTLDRRQLKKIIFEHPANRIWLEKLLHPLIRAEVKKQIESATSPYCIVVIPLLLETKPNPMIDRILVVDATEEAQLQRTQERDQLSRDEITAILKTQCSRKDRLSAADDIIENQGNMTELSKQIEKLHQFYLHLSLSRQGHTIS